MSSGSSINYLLTTAQRFLGSYSSLVTVGRRIPRERECYLLTLARACAARVIVVSSCVRLSVCPFVRLSRFFSKTAVALGFKRGML